MKTKFFMAAALMAMSLTASAQFTNSSAASATSASVGSSEGWSYIYAEYNPLTAKVDVSGADDESMTGFSLGYSKAFPITQGTPLFVEAGLGLMYVSKSDFSDVDDLNFSMFSAKIPVNLMYAFQLPNSNISIIPFAGVSLRGNISGKFTYKGEKKDKDYDVFDKKDMEELGYSDGKAWGRLQVGWQIGLKARFNDSFLLGLSYGSDMSEIAKKVTISTTSITVGYCF